MIDQFLYGTTLFMETSHFIFGVKLICGSGNVQTSLN